jgi:hypothetical protein
MILNQKQSKLQSYDKDNKRSTDNNKKRTISYHDALFNQNQDLQWHRIQA